ncbi:hypothetical protein J7K25_04250 [bacterium]|nr:hypothetical protein [bacterium]
MKRFVVRSLFVGFVLTRMLFGGMITPREKILAERAAVIDAYTRLVKNVKGCNVEGYATVSEAVTEFMYLGVNTEAFVRGARIVDKGCDKDGFAWAVVKISLKTVIENLDEIQRKLIEDGRIKINYKFKKELIETKPVIVTAVGFGAAKNVKIDNTIQPSSDELKWGPIAEARRAMSKIKIPCTTQQFILALRRAENQAILQLAEEVKGFKVIRDLLAVNDITEVDLEQIDAKAFVQGATFSNIDATPEGNVLVTVKLRIRNIVEDTNEVIRKIKGRRLKSIRIERKILDTVLKQTGVSSCKTSETGGEGELLPGSIN